MYSKFWTHLSQRDHWGSSKDAWKMLNMKHRVFEITIRIFRIHPGLLVYSYHLISILLPVMFSFITFFGVRWSPKSFPQKCTKRPRLGTSSGDVAWPVPTLPVPLSVALPCGQKKKSGNRTRRHPQLSNSLIFSLPLSKHSRMNLAHPMAFTTYFCSNWKLLTGGALIEP